MKSTKKHFLFGTIVGLAILAFHFTVTAQEVIEIKAATWHPVTHRLTDDAFKQYGQEVTKRSNGRVNFTWLLGGSLVKARNAYDGLKSGICDWTYIVPGFKPNKFLVTDLVNLPFIADNASHAAAILWRMYQEIPEMENEYKEFYPLVFFSTAVANLHTTVKAPRTLDDVKGLKIGTPSANQTKMIKLMGGSAQQIKGGDLYLALQRGMIKGLIYPDAPLRSRKLTELISHHTMMDIATEVFVVGMNRDKWNTLPPEIQKVFEDIAESASALFGATLTNESQWVIEDLKKRGDEYYYLPEGEKAKWKALMQPLYTEWVKKANKRGLDGTALFAKVQAIANETRKTPYQPDDWWGRAGRK